MKGLDGEQQQQKKIEVDHGELTQQLTKKLIQVGEIKRSLLIQMEVEEQVIGEKQRMRETLQVKVVGEHPRIQVLLAEVAGERLKMMLVLQVEEGLLIKDGETITMEMGILQDGEQQIMMLLGLLQEDGEVTKEEVEEVEIIKEMEEDLITITVEDTENLIEIIIIMKETTMEIGKEVDLSIIIARMEGEEEEMEDGKITIMKVKQVDIRKEIVKIMNLVVEVGKVLAVMTLAADGGTIIILKVKEITTTIAAVEG